MKNSLRRFTALASLLVCEAAFAQPAPVAGTAQPAAASASTPFEPQFNIEHPASSIQHLASSSQPPAPNPQPPTPSAQHPIGDRLLLEAASRLERRRSVTARLRHQVSIHEARLYGVGFYLQEGRGDDLKVRLELAIAGQDSKLLQVSNSRFQWLDRLLPTGRTLSRVDLRQLRAVLAAANTNEIQPGEASWSPAQTDLLANCGGLPRLLAALTENFTFLPPQAMRLVPAQGSEATSMPFFAVVGHWRPEKLAALLEIEHPTSNNQHPTSSPRSSLLAPRSSPTADNQIPTRLPQEVLLLVDQADLFPHRIEYRPLETPTATDPNGRPVAYQLSPRPLVVLEFSNVAFDVPIAAGQFDYAPPNVDWRDHTAAALERIHREREEKVAARTNTGQFAPPSR